MHDHLKHNLLEGWFKEMDAIRKTEPRLKESLAGMVTILHYQKKAILYRSNAVCILLNGVARSFYQYKGKDVTSGIISINERLHTVSDYSDIEEAIEFLEQAVVASISLTDFECLCLAIPAFNRFMRMIIDKQLKVAGRRSAILRIAQPEERFSLFMQLHPDVATKIPDSYIASYLGLNRSTLNRVKIKYYKYK